jgi:hypothetical protein
MKTGTQTETSASTDVAHLHKIHIIFHHTWDEGIVTRHLSVASASPRKRIPAIFARDDTLWRFLSAKTPYASYQQKNFDPFPFLFPHIPFYIHIRNDNGGL